MNLNEICGYLPYKPLTNNGIFWAICNDNLAKTKLSDGEIVKGKIENLKLVLHPLSDLTKPVLPDGKIPIVELLKICYHNIYNRDPEIDTYEVFEESRSHGVIVYEKEFEERVSLTHDVSVTQNEFEFWVDGNKLNMNQFKLFKKLYSWHFDIHGLIEKGEAIDINTLNNKIS